MQRHHVNYETGEKITLCIACHRREHGFRNGVGRPRKYTRKIRSHCTGRVGGNGHSLAIRIPKDMRKLLNIGDEEVLALFEIVAENKMLIDIQKPQPSTIGPELLRRLNE